MAVTGTKTVRDLCTRALRKAGIARIGHEPSAAMADEARQELEMMLKGWQNMGFNLWTKTSLTHTLTTSAAQQLSPERPLRILSVRYKNGGSELPMTKLTRDEYDTLPNKTTTGTPTQYHYDRQKEAARLFVWPVIATASGQTLEITYERELEDIPDISAVSDVPGEWWDAVVYNLAARLMHTVPLSQSSPEVLRTAKKLLQDAGAFDAEESVYFAGELSR